MSYMLNDMNDRKALKELGNITVSEDVKGIAKQTPKQLTIRQMAPIMMAN